MCIYSHGQKFTYTLQHLQDANYVNKIRGIIQKRFILFTSNMFTYSPQDKIKVLPRSKVYIHLIDLRIITCLVL